jgi:hypothetical protein
VLARPAVRREAQAVEFGLWKWLPGFDCDVVSFGFGAGLVGAAGKQGGGRGEGGIAEVLEGVDGGGWEGVPVSN